MKIEVFAICYNEEKLLPYFLRHYSTFCDAITIYDNQSTDSSQKIIDSNPITNLISYDTGNEIRDDIYLEIKNNCWKKSKADWVIICDIDEFVYHTYIRDILAHMDHITAITPEWFNMFSEKFPVTKRQIYTEVNRGMSGGAKLNLFRPGELTEINYGPGCHACHPEGNVMLSQWTGIKTLHFRYLSKEFVLSRNASYFARLSQQNKDNGWGFHYGFDPKDVTEHFESNLKLSSKVI